LNGDARYNSISASAIASNGNLFAYTNANDSAGVVIHSEIFQSTYLSCSPIAGQLIAMTDDYMAISINPGVLISGAVNQTAGFTFVESNIPNYFLANNIIALAAGKYMFATISTYSDGESGLIQNNVVIISPKSQNQSPLQGCTCGPCNGGLAPNDPNPISISVGSEYLAFSMGQCVNYVFIPGIFGPTTSQLQCDVCSQDSHYGNSVAMSQDDTWLAVAGTSCVYVFQLRNNAYVYDITAPQYLQWGMSRLSLYGTLKAQGIRNIGPVSQIYI